MPEDNQTKLFIFEYEGISIQGNKDKIIKNNFFKYKESNEKAKKINSIKENSKLINHILFIIKF